MAKTTTQARTKPTAGYAVGAGFLIVAVAIFLTGPAVNIPEAATAAITPDQINPGAWRAALTDPPMITSGPYPQRCNDCHTLFTNTREPGRALTQHTEITLHHGTNDGCLNCHDHADREKLTLRGGEVTDYNHVEQLCAQCHGPVFRDWNKGTHGKTLGYWNADLGEQTKLTCAQCHDPHQPAFATIEPLPGPNTLRMGNQTHHGDLINERNPLLRWRINEQSNTSTTENEGHHE